MTAVTFDSLDYFNQLKEVGVPEAQAKIQAKAIAQLVHEKLATKQDLIKLEGDLKKDLIKLEDDIKKLELSTKRDIHQLEERLTFKLTVRLGSMIVGSVTVLAILIKLL